MKFKRAIASFFSKPAISSLTSSIICVLIGLLIGFLFLLVTIPEESLIGISSIMFFQLKPEFFNAHFLGALARSAPIILSGFSVLFAFKTGLFNIGTPGQMIVGGFVGVAVGLTCPIQNAFTMVLAMFASILAGALWGFIVGLLKSVFHVHEVIASIMMNYIGTYLVAMLVKMPAFYNSAYAQTKNLPTYAQIPTCGLDELFPGSCLDISIFIVIALAIIIWLVLNKTTLGFQLKATGFNKNASQNASMKFKTNVMLSMAIAGGLAGLGGMMLFCSNYSYGLKPTYDLLIQGFDGISVALLASLNPIAALFAGFFVQYIRHGGQILIIYTSYATEIGDIIIAIIIYCSALTALIKSGLERINTKLKNEVNSKLDLREKEKIPIENKLAKEDKKE